MLYFAYGSNMDPRQMERRCPGARALGPALLRDHRLTFTWDSSRWAGGVGHVEAAPGEEVWGVLWEITDGHAGALDTYEMVEAGVYRRATRVLEHDGRPVEAMLYLALPRGYKAPSRRYLAALIRGATAFGLPDEYRSRLCALLRRGVRAASC